MVGRALNDTDWQCGYCERWFVVVSLARDCEAKHEAGEVE